MNIKELINNIKNTSKRSEKESFLKESSETAKQYLYKAFNPYIKYNITSKKFKHLVNYGNETLDSLYTETMKLLDNLSNRKITGLLAINEVENHLVRLDKSSQEILLGIFDKDLGCGISDTICNKIWDNFIPTFKVTLADKYQPEKNNILYDGTWTLQRKLDGVRCIAIIDCCTVKFYSREGIEFLTLTNLIPDLLENYKNRIIDGELCWVDDDGNENFQKIMNVLKKKDFTIPKNNLRYKIFDVLLNDEFYNNTGETYINRQSRRKSDTSVLNHLPYEIINSINDIERYKQLSLDNNWEGFMLRNGNALYEGKRTKNLLKYKIFQDAEYKVININIGNFNFQSKEGSKNIECMTSVSIEHKGNIVDVGSGFSIDERLYYKNNPENILNKIITVQYFEETITSKGISLRFPTVKCIHGNNRDL